MSNLAIQELDNARERVSTLLHNYDELRRNKPKRGIIKRQEYRDWEEEVGDLYDHLQQEKEKLATALRYYSTELSKDEEWLEEYKDDIEKSIKKCVEKGVEFAKDYTPSINQPFVRVEAIISKDATSFPEPYVSYYIREEEMCRDYTVYVNCPDKYLEDYFNTRFLNEWDSTNILIHWGAMTIKNVEGVEATLKNLKEEEEEKYAKSKLEEARLQGLLENKLDTYIQNIPLKESE